MPQFTIEEFCKYCDHGALGLDNCSFKFRGKGSYGQTLPSDQERYVKRGFCGWASLEGLQVSIFNEDPNYEGVKNLHINIPRDSTIEGTKISVRELASIKKAVEEAKRRGAGANLIIPSPSVLDRLAQEAISQ